MSFVDFLVKYYVWVLVVLIILIITIIGFLADKRLKIKKSKQNANNEKVIENNSVTEPTSLQPESILTSKELNENMNIGYVPLSEQKPNIQANSSIVNNGDNNIGVNKSLGQALNSANGFGGPVQNPNPVPPEMNGAPINAWEQPKVTPQPMEVPVQNPNPVSPEMNGAPINAWEQPKVTPQPMEVPVQNPNPVPPEMNRAPINAWEQPKVTPQPMEVPIQPSSQLSGNPVPNTVPASASTVNNVGIDNNSDVGSMFVTGNNN